MHPTFKNNIKNLDGNYRCWIDLPHFKQKSNQIRINQKSLTIYLSIAFESITVPSLNIVKILLNDHIDNATSYAVNIFSVSTVIEYESNVFHLRNQLYAVYIKFVYNNSENHLSIEKTYYITKFLAKELIEKNTKSLKIDHFFVYPMDMCPPILKTNDKGQVAYFPPAFFGETVFSRENCRTGSPMARLTCSTTTHYLAKLDWANQPIWNCESEEILIHKCSKNNYECLTGNICVDVC